MYSSDDEGRKKVEERLKETQKVFGYVFDSYSLLNIYKLFTDKIIRKFEFPIASGKESLVFASSLGNRFYAVKIYKTVASTFKNIERYGGQRWGIQNTKNKRKFISQWAYREFRNLLTAYSYQVLTPRPEKVIGNVLVMQYLGTKRRPAPVLKDFPVNDKLVSDVFGSMRLLYRKAKLVHGDLSEYNFLVYRGKPYMIDLAQAVSSKDTMALPLLRRDINNMIKFFNRSGYPFDEDKILGFVMGELDDFS
jgi:RIO kinase 1